MPLPAPQHGTGRRPSPPAGSTSPEQNVVDHGMGDHSGRCVACDAIGGEGAEDAAWVWVGEHRCGVETVAPGSDLPALTAVRRQPPAPYAVSAAAR